MEDNLTSADLLSYTTNGSRVDQVRHLDNEQGYRYLSIFKPNILIRSPKRSYKMEWLHKSTQEWVRDPLIFSLTNNIRSSLKVMIIPDLIHDHASTQIRDYLRKYPASFFATTLTYLCSYRHCILQLWSQDPSHSSSTLLQKCRQPHPPIMCSGFL